MLDEIVTLPSGTELSVEAALGDLSRAAEFLASEDSPEDWDGDDPRGLASDLGHIAELLRHLAGEKMDTTLCVSFEPGAIRAHYEGDEDDPTPVLTDDDLRKIGHYCISADSIWSLFHELLEEAVTEKVWED